VGIEDYLLRVERNLFLGAGRWLADFSESFRGFASGGETFDLFVRGWTRPKGFLLSRLFAYFSMPNYKVGLYAKHVPHDDFSLETLKKAVMARAAERNTRWTWLVLIRAGGFPDEMVDTVDGFDRPELGISLVNISDEDVDTSSNLLGRKAVSLLASFK